MTEFLPWAISIALTVTLILVVATGRHLLVQEREQTNEWRTRCAKAWADVGDLRCRYVRQGRALYQTRHATDWHPEGSINVTAGMVQTVGPDGALGYANPGRY